MPLEEKRVESQVLTKSGFLEVRRDTVILPDGKRASREYCVHPGAVAVIAVLPNGDLVLERQFRYPVGQVMIEFPAGKLDAQESGLLCAKRELKEETGYVSERWAYAGYFSPCIGYSNERIDVWLAADVQAGEQHLDEGEFLEVFTASFEQVQQWILDGVITDGKTLACFNWLAAWRHGLWVPEWQA